MGSINSHVGLSENKKMSSLDTCTEDNFCLWDLLIYIFNLFPEIVIPMELHEWISQTNAPAQGP